MFSRCHSFPLGGPRLTRGTVHSAATSQEPGILYKESFFYLLIYFKEIVLPLSCSLLNHLLHFLREKQIFNIKRE